MKILQMPNQALEELLAQELAENPALEMQEQFGDQDDIETQRIQTDRDNAENERELRVASTGENQADAFERLTNFSDDYQETFRDHYETGQSYRTQHQYDSERDPKLDALANTADRPLSLTDQLLNQWALVNTDRFTQKIGRFLIEQIDADGYLRHDPKTLALQAPFDLTADDIQHTIHLLQKNLDPTGIAASNLRECLLIQIDAKIKATRQSGQSQNSRAIINHLMTQRALVSDYLQDMQANRIPQIAHSLGLSIEQVNRAIHSLRQFHPKPGQLLDSPPTPTIHPDLVVKYDDRSGHYIAQPIKPRGMAVRISPFSQQLAKNPITDQATRNYIGEKLHHARSLLEAVQQREQTLVRIANTVAQFQHEYFVDGATALKPLLMTQVAQQLGIHESTVSRAVSDKYMETPNGIVPLRMFFSSGKETHDEDSMAWTAIQAKIRELIDSEDKSTPLTDLQIVEILEKSGIVLARRTVAKYRTQLGVPTAQRRRKF